ncbi:ADP-ribosylation factor-binding protein GGA2-like isoform X1 [Alosa sapidissima]|uniref:ADP-ribosylation factor-binding protein GGA2-like isoform X1 n=1 Tax=Alosa sapidissima TaxID=34773 RepID=UPI001C0863AA|nr:ADP-ribosylation factor-binding protein GGA2-like isoform X1 [Alosa sapidissima]
MATQTNMATGESTDTLETWLNKVTDPSNTTDRWDCIQGFYEQVNREPDGPQVATRLLAHKIQSPQEKEALQALTLLEACMNYCGKRFQSEAAKFRFLNELIKVLSPKYLGSYSPEAVKQRVTEVLYSWTTWLKDEAKVQEAYRMLKKQGVIKKDPKLPATIVMPPPTQRPEGSLFDDEDKSKLLARLLKSNKAEDLQTANRLIKNTIKEEQEKVERVSRRISTLEEVEKSTAQLRELLEQHRSSSAHMPATPHMKTVYERCDKLRPNLFRLASDTVDDDEALALILKANDKLTSVVNLYKETVEKQEVNCNGGTGASVETVSEPASPIRSYHLIDFCAFDASQPNSSASPADASPNHGASEDSNALLLFDDDMVSLGVASPFPSPMSPSRSYFEELIELEDIVSTPERPANDTGLQQRSNGTGPLLIPRGCGVDSVSQNGSSGAAVQLRPALGNLGNQNQPSVMSQSPSKNILPPLDKSLTDIFVSLDSVKPSRLEPITVYDRWGVHVCLHFCRDSPPTRTDIAVVIVSTVNTSALPISDVQFQVAVPKSMVVKLQPATGKDLPPYNPLLPPASISQILLLANPQRSPVRLRHKLTLKHGDEMINELGEIDHFPEWYSWTRS